ncbi:uncharacterized protein B0I36DRAFT_332489 [Microdochium trichocladiopsis]|uniref:PNPLA domain-containing protein n=1 Tax=Microdochium trichocladiopsis TaxID=1682393 RepID=A0A9P9BJC1_9PEZI|nr:uncharacterized protein B0I36DRAFT_332489 [Microdochium trichocladiopsis]KAH7025073.1 hypothetical protein B0I36DRAFT_332489 [Microdochium trichocladiopsis]
MASLEPLRILSLDGGGIRGVSSLLILENVMEQIHDAERLDHVPRPCDRFDLIGGTSTGEYITLVRMSGVHANDCAGSLQSCSGGCG